MAVGREALLRAKEERLRSAWRGRPKESAAGAASAVGAASSVQSSLASTSTETCMEYILFKSPDSLFFRPRAVGGVRRALSLVYQQKKPSCHRAGRKDITLVLLLAVCVFSYFF